MRPPERAFWPLCPLPAVPPRPVAAPLPRRLLFLTAPTAWCRSESFMTIPLRLDLFHLQQVDDLVHHAADLRRVVVLDRVLHALDAERAQRLCLVVATLRGAPDLGDPKLERHRPSGARPAAPGRSCHAPARRRRRGGDCAGRRRSPS